jgi:hypothetical protein
MSKKGIRALVYVSLVSVVIWGATGYLVMEAVRSYHFLYPAAASGANNARRPKTPDTLARNHRAPGPHHLGRNRLSGDGSGTCVVMSLAAAWGPGARWFLANVSGAR